MYGDSNSAKQQPMQRLQEACLLVLLCDKSIESCHGYVLSERMAEFGFADGDLSVSTLYRTLRGMEDAGWVASSWADGILGPKRREYAITDAGRAALDEWAAVLVERRARISELLDAYARMGGSVDASGKPSGRRKTQIVTAKPAAAKPVRAAKPAQKAEPKTAKQESTESLDDYWD